MSMKRVLEVGVKKYGTIANLHKELIRSGVDVSLSTLTAALKHEERGEFTRKLYSKLNQLLHDGDWKKTGKLIDEG